MTSNQSTAVIERLRQAGCVLRIRALPDPKDAGSTLSGGSPPLEVVGPVPMPMTIAGREVCGRWYVATPSGSDQRSADCSVHVSVVVFGDLSRQTGLPLVRIHSTCFTGDVLGSLRCDCGPQLQSALRQVSESETGGMIVYMAAHEGRGVGLWSKAVAYLLQDQGLDTYEANRALGFADDQRDFRHAAALIDHLLDGRSFRLLTNNPMKVNQMRALGLRGVVQESHVAGVGRWNGRYLNAKRAHGHCIPSSALDGIDA